MVSSGYGRYVPDGSGGNGSEIHKLYSQTYSERRALVQESHQKEEIPEL